MIDLLYVACNRLAFTTETTHALLRHTDWSLVRRLYVHDDGSDDGTAEFLDAALEKHTAHLPDLDVVFQSKQLGGPVAAMNWLLEHSADDPCDVFGKVDNDMVVCPGWLNEMLRVLNLHPDLDILGMEPFVGGPEPVEFDAFGSIGAWQNACWLEGRTITPASHIGGKGLIRRRAFEHPRSDKMWADGYQGFTQWQHRNRHVRKAWITPDLPVFGLDQIPVEEWQQITAGYVADGVQRAWPPYHHASRYHEWWQPATGHGTSNDPAAKDAP